MLFLEDKFVWVDEIKDSEIINWYYNLYNLGRYIEAHKREYIKKEAEKWDANPFHKHKLMPSFDLGKYIDLDIISSHHRNIMSIFDVNNISSISDFLKSIDEFTDLVLFILRLKNDAELKFMAPHMNSFNILEKNNKKIFSKGNLKVEIEISSITKGSSGNVILDMLEGNKDKYITLFTITICDKVYTFISDEKPDFTPEDKIMLSTFCDATMEYVHKSMCELTAFLIKKYYGSDIELISNNLSRGKIYV